MIRVSQFFRENSLLGQVSEMRKGVETLTHPIGYYA